VGHKIPSGSPRLWCILQWGKSSGSNMGVSTILGGYHSMEGQECSQESRIFPNFPNISLESMCCMRAKCCTQIALIILFSPRAHQSNPQTLQHCKRVKFGQGVTTSCRVDDHFALQIVKAWHHMHSWLLMVRISCLVFSCTTIYPSLQQWFFW